MAKVTLRLDTRAVKKDGTYPLKIAVARGKTFWIPLDVSLKESEWSDEKQCIVNKAYPNRAVIQSYIMQRRSAVEQRLLALQANGTLKTYTDKALQAYLKQEDEVQQPNYFKDSYKQFIELKANANTKRIYQRTFALMAMYCDISRLIFEDITVTWLNGFRKFLMSYCGSKNGESMHFRNIRAIFNFAISQDAITCYPFRKFKIEHEATEKRSMTVEQLRKFIEMPVTNSQQKYKDAFLLTFYLIGINIIDLSELHEVIGGRIHYRRKKTRRLYDIKVEPEAQCIIDRYKGISSLLEWFEYRSSYTSFAKRCNINLRKMGVKLGIKNLTLYWARHTWATLAYELDIPDDTISRALGHSQSTGAQVTQVYIRTNNKKVDKANRRIINYIRRIES